MQYLCFSSITTIFSIIVLYALNNWSKYTLPSSSLTTKTVVADILEESHIVVLPEENVVPNLTSEITVLLDIL